MTIYKHLPPDIILSEVYLSDLVLRIHDQEAMVRRTKKKIPGVLVDLRILLNKEDSRRMRKHGIASCLDEPTPQYRRTTTRKTISAPRR
jgi:hypothetical protein